MSFSPAELSKWCHGEIKLIISDRIHRIRDIACYGGKNLYLMLEQTHVIMIEQTEIKATGGVKQIQEKRSKPTEMSRIVATEATLCRHKRTGQKRFPPAKQKGKTKTRKTHKQETLNSFRHSGGQLRLPEATQKKRPEDQQGQKYLRRILEHYLAPESCWSIHKT